MNKTYYRVEVTVYWKKNKTFSLRERIDEADTMIEAIEVAARQVEWYKAQGFNCTASIWTW